MKFGILVNEGPYNHQASDSAYQFAMAALEKGHQIFRVFFYYDGVNNANRLQEPQSDDRNLVKMWSKLPRIMASTWWCASPPACAAASRTKTWLPVSGSPDWAS